MNRFLISLILITTIYSVSYSQVAFDIKGGINASTESGYLKEFHPRWYIIQPSVGFVARKTLSPKWELAPELLLNGEGFKSPGYFKYSLYYISLPVNIRYTISEKNNKTTFLAAGVFLNEGIFGKATYNLQAATIPGNDPVIGVSPVIPNIFGKYLRRFDTGINIGAGMKMRKATIGLNYSMGLISTYGYNSYLSLYFAWQIFGK